MGLFSKRRKKSRLGSNPLLRWFGPSATSAGLLYALYLFFTGGLDFASFDKWFSSEEAPFQGERIELSRDSDRPQDHIRIATFNIFNFGEDKSNIREHPKTKVDVLSEIAKIVNRFDLVAIQEVRTGGASVDNLVAFMNASGANYSAVVSQPIGDKNRTECYAFVWDQNRIALVPGSSYVVRDPDNRMYREPMVASFQTVLSENENATPFRFTAINVHTDPDLVDPLDRDSEINVLADVFQRVRDWEFARNSEDDFIVMGDLNVSTDELGMLSKIRGVVSVAGDIGTNLLQTKTNDHILIDQNVTREFANKFGVIDLIDEWGFTSEQAGSISDHLPLFADFSRFEMSAIPQTASMPPDTGTRVVQ
ncbi:MAG: endonuclease/exonuclease/phosphatase family protein [Planctomycetota bacterium]